MAAAYACTHEHPFSALFGGIAADMEAATHQQRACHGRCGAGIRSFPPGRNACHAGSPSAAGSPAAGSRLIRLNVLEVAPCLPALLLLCLQSSVMMVSRVLVLRPAPPDTSQRPFSRRSEIVHV